MNLTYEQKKVAEEVMKTGHEIITKQGRLSIMYFILTKEGVIPLIPPIPEDGDEEFVKDLMADAVSFIAKKSGAEMALMIDEIWMAVHKAPPDTSLSIKKTGEWMEKENIPKPSKDPNRQEGLIVVATLPGGESYMLLSKMHRDEDGKPHLEKPEWQKFTVETRMLKAWATDA